MIKSRYFKPVHFPDDAWDEDNVDNVLKNLDVDVLSNDLFLVESIDSYFESFS